ncbi:MAG: hypothetical protein E7E58_06975 [Paeniclostridium sordellii]|nr:hypothetical protein [Paeniclostridium sordellii]
MSNDIKLVNKEINSFLIINFALIAFISIFIFMVKSKSDSVDFISNFAVLFMYIPAFSVIVVLKKIENYSFTPTVDKFLKVFVIATILRIIISIVEVFLIDGIILSSLIDTFVSLYLLYLTLYNASEFEALNLSITKNFEKVLFVILIFTMIKLIGLIPDFFDISSKSVNIGEIIVMGLIGLISNFFIGFSLFLVKNLDGDIFYNLDYKNFMVKK